ITSMRHLGQIDWGECFEDLSKVDGILRGDPIGVYSRTDFATRDRCRHVIEQTAKRCDASELDVASEAISLAQSGVTEQERHVGYFLLDQGRTTLESRVSCVPRFGERSRRWSRAHAAPI